jgi:hypothetical protein
MLVVLLFGILAMVIALTTGSRIMTVVYAGLLALVFAMVSHRLSFFVSSSYSPFFLMLLLLLVSSFLPSDFLASFIGLAVLFSFVSSPFPVAAPILIYNYFIYLHNLCLCIIYTPILLDNEF